MNALPCPFCGGNEIENMTTFFGSGVDQTIYAMKFCDTCGVEGPAISVTADDLEPEERLLEVWNKRSLVGVLANTPGKLVFIPCTEDPTT